jgi:hypothetical protein
LIPLDDEIQRFDLEQRSLLDIPDTSPAVLAVRKMLDIIINKNTVGSTE